MEKTKKKNIILYIVYGLLTVLILITILSMNDLDEIGKALVGVDIKNLFIAIGLTLIYLALYPLSMCFLVKSEKVDIKFFDAYSIGMTEHFFNGITPFSTGGQPFQMYAFSQKKVKLATSTSILMMNYIIFMIITNSYAIGSLFYYDKFVGNNVTMQIIAIIGFTMNFLVLFFLIALMTSKKLKNAIIWILTKLSHIKFLHNFLENKIHHVEEYIDQTQSAFKSLWKHKLLFFVCLITKAITMGIYYAITFFIIRALHVDINFDHLFLVIFGSAFAITMVVFLPTPGSSGGIEFAFAAIISALSTNASGALSNAGMLIWRLMTYYLTMLISLGFYIGFEIKVKIDNKKMAKLENKLEEEK